MAFPSAVRSVFADRRERHDSCAFASGLGEDSVGEAGTQTEFPPARQLFALRVEHCLESVACVLAEEEKEGRVFGFHGCDNCLRRSGGVTGLGAVIGVVLLAPASGRVGVVGDGLAGLL